MSNYLSFALADQLTWTGSVASLQIHPLVLTENALALPRSLSGIINKFRYHRLGLEKLTPRSGPSVLDRIKVRPALASSLRPRL